MQEIGSFDVGVFCKSVLLCHIHVGIRLMHNKTQLLFFLYILYLYFKLNLNIQNTRYDYRNVHYKYIKTIILFTENILDSL